MRERNRDVGWSGITTSSGGMARQSYDLQLTRYGEGGWRATFFPDGARALRHFGGRVGVGTGAVGRGAAGGVGELAEKRG
jgi:hypothetical protein